ncbi:GerAB/ArcD/ProY family transporter [Sporosarcina sp. GW1-11]|uniref:GerAB/ArcD/ProY family transporter n=1 Tax=Sporosarcina sp. GW1-11 TaxID=2899126 RepID=UPI00294CD929|nr:GerAB/ArcD/ProY family transporter [Sporosarcina sp. GW1-11]MDV6378337.1 GerAB/ArcD/ProY family transporter [Sporosarcina sp. GW1-11]
MSRFVYYLLISNMVANMIAAGPRILFSKSEQGAIVSMIIALFFGVFINWALIKFFNAFSGESLPEILDLYVKRWISIPILVVLGSIWYIAGLQTLITYVDLLLRFLAPEMSVYTTLSMFIVVISFGVIMKSRSILFTLELVFVMLLPFAIYYVIKLYFSPQISWDYVRLAMSFIDNPPNYTVFSTTLFFFIGTFDIIVFNSLLKKKMIFGLKEATFVFLLGAFTIFTTYFIPIGVLGFDRIKDFIYPWIFTSDSIRMKFGVIERVVFIFLLIFLAVAFLSIMIHWHVSFKLFENVFRLKKSMTNKGKTIRTCILLVAFWVVAFFITVRVTEYDLFTYSSYYFNLMSVVIVGLLSLLWMLNRRAKS